MEVGAIAGGTSATENKTAAAQQSLTVDYNAFLQLLIAELKNQDPTEPMKSSDYVAQLASFSNVEQGIQTNTKLDTLLTATALSQYDGLIGRNIQTGDGQASGEVAAIRVISGGAIAITTSGQEITLGPGITVS
ncbi:MAG: flagellar hook assembly protein FlgD [Hyphomicrobiaceae bacterium]